MSLRDQHEITSEMYSIFASLIKKEEIYDLIYDVLIKTALFLNNIYKKKNYYIDIERYTEWTDAINADLNLIITDVKNINKSTFFKEEILKIQKKLKSDHDRLKSTSGNVELDILNLNRSSDITKVWTFLKSVNISNKKKDIMDKINVTINLINSVLKS